MPWAPKDAKKHTKKAVSTAKMRQWSTVANSVLKDTGDEGKAIRIANAAISRSKKKGKGK